MKLTRIVAAAAFALASTSAFAEDITIKNESNWQIDQFYLSSTSVTEWGPDQLGAQAIGSGGQFQLTGVPCDKYDVRIVDEDEDVCVVKAVDLCGAGGWTITSEALVSCQQATANTGAGE